MNKRFFLIVLTLIISLFSLSSTDNVLAATNSPKSNYTVYITSANVNVYNKPNGKKVETIKRWAGNENDGGPGIPNTFVVKKFVANNWVQVAHKKANNKTVQGYVQTKYISPNYLSLDFAMIDSTNGLNLRAAPNTKSKVLKVIPYGTRVDIIDDDNTNYGWFKVKYVVNNKSVIGYISKKYVR
ncbi:SH3 domain-containing protein [Bacillus sp. REN10]|uniref:SH3 domain-containing protein n=1 Tax=Bacillus sp. REN10 TaxID=2782541 RepID=UPI00193BFBF5|nr:SH3 domain-containing protein [Bacillus sp. REN10]